MNEGNIVLIVDDEEQNRFLLKQYLENDYNVIEAADGKEAVEYIDKYGLEIGIILLDIIMPEMDGFQVLDYLNDYGYMPLIPVILITADSNLGNEKRAFEAGVSDFIAKPFSPVIVSKRVHNVIDLFARSANLQKLVEEKTEEVYTQSELLMEQEQQLKQNNDILMEGLSTIVEFRAIRTGEHIYKMKEIIRMLCSLYQTHRPELNITEEDIKAISLGGVIHDIGMVAISDEILNKPTSLTHEEYEQVKCHTGYGVIILQKFEGLSDKKFLDYATEICYHHHERIDGTGYPDGLKGDDIPYYVQIVSLADVYDALTSAQPYRKAYTHEEAVEMILNGECGAFSDELIAMFKLSLDMIQETYKSRWSEMQ